MLKFNVTAEEYEKLAESLQSEYKQVEDGDGYELDLDGGIPGLEKANDALNEFRTNNRSLHKQVKDLQADLEKAKEDAAEAKKAAEEKGKDTVNARVAALEKKVAAAEAAQANAEQKVKDATFNTAVRKAAKAAGVADAALDDATEHLRNRRGMRLQEDDQVLAEDGTTLKEALASMRKEQGYFFGKSSGAGTPPEGGKAGGEEPTTVKRGTFLENADTIKEKDVVVE